MPAMALDLWGGTTGVFAGLDRFGRTIDHRWQATGLSSIDLDRYRYGYDRNANPLYRQHYIATDSDELYTYDRFDRLTSMKRGALNSAHDALTATPVVEAAWTLDRLGNWLAYQTKVAGTTDLAQTRTANKVNEITAVTNTTGPTWANIAYDAAGNMTTAPKGEDETTLLKYAYDGWNRLVKVKDASDALIATYAYDGTGRRTGKAFPTGSAFTSEDTYYNAGYQAVETRRPGTVYEQTVFDAKYIDAVLVRYRDADSNIKGLDETLFFTHDRMFNVTGVWDASRTAVERYRYTPYGERSVLDATFLGKTGNASTVDQRRGHQGLVFDDETGAYYNRARQLLPQPGVFNRRDPLGYFDGANSLEYAGSGPNRFVDPSGRTAIDELTNGTIYSSGTVGDDFGDWELRFRPGDTPGGPDAPANLEATGLKLIYTRSKTNCNCTSVEIVQFVRLTVDGKVITGKDVAQYLDGRTWADDSGWNVDQSADNPYLYYQREKDGNVISGMTAGSSVGNGIDSVVVDVPSYIKTKDRMFAWDFTAIAVCTAGKDKDKVYDAVSWNVTKIGEGKFGSTVVDGKKNPTVMPVSPQADLIVNAIVAWNKRGAPTVKMIPTPKNK